MATDAKKDPAIPAATQGIREPRLRKPPYWMISILLVLAVATWLPLVLVAKSRVSTSDEPRVHLFQDMGRQPKYREQQSSELFADGRADRLLVEGTVARGSLQEDDHYYRGYARKTDASGKTAVTFFADLPEQVKITPELLQRGQERFNIYCAACHGQDGYGNGPVNARAQELQEPKWVPPSSLHSDPVRARAAGHIYNTINVGIRNMPGYGTQIPVADRWAIVAYVRALQFSQNAPLNVVPAEKRDTLK